MKIKLFPILMLLLFFSGSILGQVPQTINYQGVLTQPSGDPVPNGNYNLTFRLYDAAVAGTELWIEVQIIPVENGIFNVILGDVTPFALDFDAPYWLSIQVAVDPELSPRVELTGVPYSSSSASTEGIQYRPVDPGSPVNGQVLKWDGASWSPANDNAGTSVWDLSGNDIYNTNSGHVGIRTSAPTNDLEINQSTGTAAGTGGLKLTWTTDNWKVYHSGVHCSFAENGVRRAYIEAGTGAYVQVSDRNLKKNVEPLGSVLQNVLKLNPVKFHYLDNDEDIEKTQGFIAQDVDQLFPEIVREDEQGNKLLAYDNFAILAIKAIQEQQKLIEDLQNKVRMLENR